MTGLDTGTLILLTYCAAAVIVAEIAVSWFILRARRNRRLSLIANGGAGLCLVMAVRSALLGETAAVAALLTCSFVAHIADVGLRSR